MHIENLKSVRRILDIEQDSKVKPSAKVEELIERGEKLMRRYYGRTTEFQIDALVVMLMSLKEDELTESTAPPLEELSRKDLIAQCESKGVKVKGNEAKADLISMLG